MNDRLDQIISDRHALAESKAILRAIRATGTRQVYTRQEFARPFVVQRIDLAPDMSDPAMREALANRALQSSDALFGERGGVKALPASAPVSEAPDFAAAEREGRFEQVAPLDLGEEEVPTPAGPSPWDDEPAEPSREEVLTRVETDWTAAAAALKAGKIEAMPPRPPGKDAPIANLLAWCESCEGFLGIGGGQ